MHIENSNPKPPKKKIVAVMMVHIVTTRNVSCRDFVEGANEFSCDDIVSVRLCVTHDIRIFNLHKIREKQRRLKYYTIFFGIDSQFRWNQFGWCDAWKESQLKFQKKTKKNSIEKNVRWGEEEIERTIVSANNIINILTLSSFISLSALSAIHFFCFTTHHSIASGSF